MNIARTSFRYRGHFLPRPDHCKDPRRLAATHLRVAAPSRAPAAAEHDWHGADSHFLKSRSVSSWSTPPTTGILVLGLSGGAVSGPVATTCGMEILGTLLFGCAIRNSSDVP